MHPSGVDPERGPVLATTEELEAGGLVAPSPGSAAPTVRYRLLIFQGEAVTTFPLPPSGEVSIGRGEESAIRLELGSISRRHALLRLGEGVTLEDLGSANGTRVRGERLTPHQPRALSASEVVELGEVTAVLQRWSPALDGARPRRLLTHASFEDLLEDACARAGQGGLPPAVARLRLGEGVGAAPRIIAGHLEPGEHVAVYAPGELELLLLGAPAALGQRLEQLTTRLRAGGATVLLGLACFGREGRTPERLLARAIPRAPELPGGDVVVQDLQMQRLHDLARRVAQGTLPVLLLGETGTGKEVLAEALHRYSPRAGGPYLRLNCAAFSGQLLESELFGHAKGAFTGATASKPGLLETASGGTVLLDEVGELPPELQAKLLRVLEQREIRRVGELQARPIDVRFVSATNRDLETWARSGAFRQDLYYRLNGVALQLPPLREREAELKDLALTFIAQGSRALGRARPTLAPRALEALRQYRWPGNIRELRNVIDRALLLCDGPEIDIEHLPLERMRAGLLLEPLAPERPSTDAPQRRRILQALEESGGNQTEAARRLGITSKTLRAWCDQHGIARPRAGKRDP